jgi:hypothetical protein
MAPETVGPAAAYASGRGGSVCARAAAAALVFPRATADHVAAAVEQGVARIACSGRQLDFAFDYGVRSCLCAENRATFGAGADVTTSSAVWLQAPLATAPYMAAKYAVWLPSETSTAEDAAQGIRTNPIAPGTTRTKGIECWFTQVPGMDETLYSMTSQRGPPAQKR